MTVGIGDIVMLGSGMRYVVADVVANPNGAYSNARLLRKNRDGGYAVLIKDTKYLEAAKRPTFERNDKVQVFGGLTGTLLGVENDIARVLLPEREQRCGEGIFITWDASVVRLPIAVLIIENHRV